MNHRRRAMKRIVSVMTKAVFATAVLVALALPAAARNLVYIPLGSAGEILIVDPEQDKVIGRFEKIPDVHGLAATPDGTILIAGSFAETGPGDSALPAKPEAMSQNEHEAHHSTPEEREATNDNAISFVSIVQTKDGSVAMRIEVPGAVHHTAVTPDGLYAVATHPNQGAVSVIDVTKHQIMVTIETGSMPNYAVIGPEGKRIYVSNTGNNTVSEIDTEKWIVRRDLDARSSPEHMVLSPDGDTLYVNNVDDGTVSEIPLQLGVVTRTFEVGGALHGIDLSDDGQTLFVSGREQNKLVAIDLETGELFSAPLAPSPYHLTAIDGTDKLYVSSAKEPKIWVVGQPDLKVLGEIPIRGEGHQMVQAPAR
jgi:DNA-binding beta-propeller fold protein YncE